MTPEQVSKNISTIIQGYETVIAKIANKVADQTVDLQNFFDKEIKKDVALIDRVKETFK